jgi:DNA-binding response OmpR family regulator
MRYVFADGELDTQLCAVRRGTTQHPLRPKPFQVLLYLLEHRDRVVPKQSSQSICGLTSTSVIRSSKTAFWPHGGP